MDTAIAAIITVLVGLVLGALGGYFARVVVAGRRHDAATREASRILEEAQESRRNLLIEAREEALKTRSDAEAELKERRGELGRLETRLSNREENTERRAANLERRERSVVDKEKEVEGRRSEAESLKQQQIQRLEEVSRLSVAEAKGELMRVAELDIKHELVAKYRDMEVTARAEAESNARNILSGAIQRLASDVVSEVSLTTVPLPSDDMKGRLIGREGRNIRAIEKATGVDLIIDETPEAVTLSCFDPIRREVARLAVTKLVADGRIHPARIEDMVTKAEKDVEETVRRTGDDAVMEVDVRGLRPGGHQPSGQAQVPVQLRRERTATLHRGRPPGGPDGRGDRSRRQGRQDRRPAA